jgi:hypothetical protein
MGEPLPVRAGKITTFVKAFAPVSLRLVLAE